MESIVRSFLCTSCAPDLVHDVKKEKRMVLAIYRHNEQVVPIIPSLPYWLIILIEGVHYAHVALNLRGLHLIFFLVIHFLLQEKNRWGDFRTIR